MVGTVYAWYAWCAWYGTVCALCTLGTVQLALLVRLLVSLWLVRCAVLGVPTAGLQACPMTPVFNWYGSSVWFGGTALKAVQLYAWYDVLYQPF